MVSPGKSSKHGRFSTSMHCICYVCGRVISKNLTKFTEHRKNSGIKSCSSVYLTQIQHLIFFHGGGCVTVEAVVSHHSSMGNCYSPTFTNPGYNENQQPSGTSAHQTDPKMDRNRTRLGHQVTQSLCTRRRCRPRLHLVASCNNLP